MQEKHRNLQNKLIKGKYYMAKGINQNIVEAFAQLSDLDCSVCYSKDVQPTGAYTQEGTGFYVDVKCHACGAVTECGDSEFLTEVAEFKNEKFYTLVQE